MYFLVVSYCYMWLGKFFGLRLNVVLVVLFREIIDFYKFFSL